MKAAVAAARKLALAKVAVPKTSYEFTRTWKSLKSSAAAQHKFVLDVEAAGRSAKIFRKSLEADLLLEVVAVLAEHLAPANAATTLRLAAVLGSAQGIDLTIMFFSKKDKAAVGALFDKLDAALVGAAAGSDLAGVAAARAKFLD